MGYLRGLTHGAIAGAILGLLYAPESGLHMRQRVSRLLGQAEDMMAADSGAEAVGGAPQEQKAGPGAHRRRTMDQTVEKTIDRLSDLLDRANKAAQDLEVKDRLTDAVAALRRTRLTQDEDAGIERFVTGLLIGVAVGFGLALLLAPKSGEEMRDDLMQRGIELRDRAGELAQRMPFGDGEQGRTEKASTDQPGIA